MISWGRTGIKQFNLFSIVRMSQSKFRTCLDVDWIIDLQDGTGVRIQTFTIIRLNCKPDYSEVRTLVIFIDYLRLFEKSVIRHRVLCSTKRLIKFVRQKRHQTLLFYWRIIGVFRLWPGAWPGGKNGTLTRGTRSYGQ